MLPLSFGYVIATFQAAQKKMNVLFYILHPGLTLLVWAGIWINDGF